jgi:hypothetical protein
MTEATQRLLNNYAQLSFDTIQPTYLELCRYPRRRFEEIYSRLLKFFLQPTNPHGLETLFIDALIECITDEQVLFDPRKVEVTDEEYADGKWIDVVIKSDTFIIGIENKFFADLYNPLEVYSKRLRLEHSLRSYGVVLSFWKFNSEEAKQLMTEAGFSNVTYSQLFTAISKRRSEFIHFNPRYACILDDMIKTLENMEAPAYAASEKNIFFFRNAEQIESLMEEYEQYSATIRGVQSNRIASIHELVNKTTDGAWWIWNGYDLGYTFTDNKKRLGIESEFVNSETDPFATFVVKITTWNVSDWSYFAEKITPAFSQKNEIKHGRMNMSVLQLTDETDEAIALHLTDVWKRVHAQRRYC